MRATVYASAMGGSFIFLQIALFIRDYPYNLERSPEKMTSRPMVTMGSFGEIGNIFRGRDLEMDEESQ